MTCPRPAGRRRPPKRRSRPGVPGTPAGVGTSTTPGQGPLRPRPPGRRRSPPWVGGPPRARSPPPSILSTSPGRRRKMNHNGSSDSPRLTTPIVPCNAVLRHACPSVASPATDPARSGALGRSGQCLGTTPHTAPMVPDVGRLVRPLGTLGSYQPDQPAPRRRTTTATTPLGEPPPHVRALAARQAATFPTRCPPGDINTQVSYPHRRAPHAQAALAPLTAVPRANIPAPYATHVRAMRLSR
jgi:hypothetical protein